MLGMRLHAARARTALWRFRTLQYARRALSTVPAGVILQRRLFSHRMWLDVGRSDYHKLLFLEGERLIAERAVVSSLLRRGMTVVDVGANIGYYMLLFRRSVGSEGTIICIEPDEENLQELRRQIAGNSLLNVTVMPVAAGAVDGKALLEPGINARVREGGREGREVALRRLDSLLQSPIDVLKIDVEGYEGFVLDGATEALRRWKPSVFLEVHPQLLEGPYSVQGIVGVLVGLGGPVEGYTLTSASSLLGKVKARYLGGTGLRHWRVPDLIEASQSGDQRDPFWVVRRAG